MKLIVLIGLLAAGGAAFYFTGGMEWLGTGEEKALPASFDVPASTFMGDADDNPYAK